MSMPNDDMESSIIAVIEETAKEGTRDQLRLLATAYGLPYNTMLRDIPDHFHRMQRNDDGSISSAEADRLINGVLDSLLNAIALNDEWMKKIHDESE